MKLTFKYSQAYFPKTVGNNFFLYHTILESLSVVFTVLFSHFLHYLTLKRIYFNHKLTEGL